MNKKQVRQFRKEFVDFVNKNVMNLQWCGKAIATFDKKMPIVRFKFANRDCFITKQECGEWGVGIIGGIGIRFPKLADCFEYLEKHLIGYVDYGKIIESQNERIKEFQTKLRKVCSDLADMATKTCVYKVIHNKGATVVWFGDGEKVVVKKAKGDKDSVYSAVAYAIAKRLYKNNTNFKKKVDEAVICNAK